MLFFGVEDLSSQGNGVLLALASSCHSLIIQWHLSSTMLNQISVVSFWGFCSMHFFTRWGYEPHAQPSSFLKLVKDSLWRSLTGKWGLDGRVFDGEKRLENLRIGALFTQCAADVTLITDGILHTQNQLKTMSNIYNGAFCDDNCQLLAVNCFCEELHHRCLTEWLI